jgi:glycosyltransferase involved in cell wall biosynthesis
VSVVLAVHSEGALLQRTLLSLDEAARHARTDGITVELVATLDRADDLTRQVLHEFGTDGFDGWTVIEVDHGSLGPSRNSGISAARGDYIYTCDGDDLVSFNSFVAMFRLAEAAGPEHVIFHQYLYAFGYRPHCWRYFPLDTVTPLIFLEQQPYTSAAFAHRSVFEAVPYTDSRVSSGYAYEDWHFNAECVARGYGVLVAEDTIMFYRQRRGSLLHQADSQTTRQIFPSTLFEPETWVRITRDAYERLAPHSGARPGAPDGARWAGMRDSALQMTFIRAANAIDPGVDPVILRRSPIGSNLGGPDLAAGLAYHEICQIIGAQRFEEVFLLPFISTGGAERYVYDVMQALYDMRPTKRMLVLLGEPLAGGSHIDRVPPNATVLDLAGDWSQLTMEQCELISLKLIQSVAPRARLHLRPAPFCHGFYDRFKSILRSNPAVYYRFCDEVENSPAGVFARPLGFNFVSEHVQDLALIVTDNQTIIMDDHRRIGVYPEKWRWLPARHAPLASEAEAVARAVARKGRVLWASRLDRQKRPALLPHIAAKLRQLGSDIRIDVFGSTVLNRFRLGRLRGCRNLSYRGGFDGFAVLDHAYDAFVYTSAFDGMPNVILEAIAAGLPVIAPDVGGIREIIVDGESGLLLPSLTDDAEMAAAYAAAIVRLADNGALRAKIVAGALKRLVDRHSPAAFAEAARAIFGGRDVTATGHRSNAGPNAKSSAAPQRAPSPIEDDGHSFVAGMR